MSNSIIITIIICATVVSIFVIACIHETIKTTAAIRSIKKFDAAFKDFAKKNAANNATTSELTPEGWKPLDFPNDFTIEKRPGGSMSDKYH